MKTLARSKAWFTAINYSAGRQSEWLLEKILRKELDVYLPMIFNANPGMETDEGYRRVAAMQKRCEEAGIYFEVVTGPNLYEDLINGTCREHPPFFTGEGGMIGHHCTREYKIYPIRRALRRVLRKRFFTKTTYPGIVDSLICFAAEEEHRIKDKKENPEYQNLRYPLIELGVTTDDVHADFQRWGVPMPKPSLCNGCFAHGLRSFSQMNENEFAQAVAVDEAIRNHKFNGLDAKSLFVNNTMLPLVELKAQGFKLEDERENAKYQCDSGVCFI